MKTWQVSTLDGTVLDTFEARDDLYLFPWHMKYPTNEAKAQYLRLRELQPEQTTTAADTTPGEPTQEDNSAKL